MWDSDGERLVEALRHTPRKRFQLRLLQERHVA
jgi:hypothetical protein